MKKNKKRRNEPTNNDVREKGETTLEIDAIMEAAAESTAEIGIILEGQEDTAAPAPTEAACAAEADTAEPEAAAEDIPAEDTAVHTADTDSNAPLTANAIETAEDEAVSRETIPAEDTPVAAEAPLQPKEAEEPGETGTEAAETPEASEKVDEKPLSSTLDNSPLPEEDYKKLGIYLHVPFCRSKCAYCDFYSTDKIRCEGHKTPDEMKRYTKALINHMRILSERTTQYNVDTVFIGGGTPTALPEKLLLSIVKEVSDCFYLDENCEFTVEMNPATANEKTLKKLRRCGVNRLSIGLQSSHNHELAALSRIHCADDFVESFQMAREAGFDNINVDVMFGIPEQTKDSFLETLAFVTAMKPEHISMYNLRIEDGTPFGEKKHMLPLPDEDTECDMYFEGIDYLASQGYRQYEISNFAKEGCECRHNLRYWHGEECLGCGPAAHSYFGGSRFSLKRSLAQYTKALEVKGKSIPASLRDENYQIDKKEEIAEYLMLRLRLAEGISTEDFRKRFGGDFDAVFGKKLMPYIEHELMTHKNGRYAFTPQGMFVSNMILSRIIPFEPKLGKL